ncbi:DEAD/DEAH box helicase family protein [Paenibacillus larvae]|uniref:Phage related protein n=2 Tax=Paenibacillus larvae TaxID=1464 RepID=A0A6C0QX41_9BACL|nr:DEAD/DEAH box helicase family protein [Paenibacillus larvae]AQR78224.1 type III deoxyribonuclease [Paenibacillus larvae subsp. larvae]AVF20573.1 phage related protein [Paenibacillus larvae subsp. larvae]ETK28469.1 phage related protein [Paenibacillus larvae subsp. larvae DSM 25719]MCY7476427.1 DEAD/DEAH box helicase family protein [Paenibacillus larvae]MCY7491254.1 DEAD/DEAH box helicase family protein [Paenibacillus larvae]
MRDILFLFQEKALSELHDKINKAHLMWSERDPQIISFSAPTGSGKTIIMTTLFEDILYGSADNIGEPDSIFIWLSDSPELNEQTRLKIESKSDKIRVRDLVTIDSTFNAEYFEGGCIYFLNTQKLGSDKLLTGISDKRQYSIWETLTNTAKRNPKKFYVVIDEAHRGTYTSVQAENKAQSIMQKFIKGSKEDGLCVMPLVIGVTATPQRFDNLIAGTTSTVQKVIVPPEQVRESGLLKDRIIIHYPDIQLSADMTMFKGAVDNWRKKCDHWESYCEREGEKMVNPILVIQVEDGNDRIATQTDLGACIDLLEETLGRMIRTPLARRISSDAELNSVSLFLPYFDEETVKNVVNALRDSEAIMPTETGTNKELVTLGRNLEYSDVFDAMDNLITYQIDSARKQAPLKLLIQISRALTMDGIDLEAQKTVKNAVLSKMDEEISRIKESGDFDTRGASITGFALGTLIFEYGDNAYSFDEATQTMTVSEFDISRHFEQAGRLLGEGLHKEYWIRHSTRDHIDVKKEIIVLTNDTDAMERINDYAEKEFITLYENNKRSIARLNEARKNVYERLTNASAQPISVPWILPDSIDFSVPDNSMKFEQHLYCSEDGTFETSLNPWESGVVTEELNNGAVCWLRNLDRKKWSLEIPYEISGVTTSMFPDLVVVRSDAQGYVFDILEPHDPSRKDNYPKVVGLAKFAEKHWDIFGRIQLIRLKKGVDGREHFYRLDMGKTTIRNKVRGITSNEELDRIFDTDAVRED